MVFSVLGLVFLNMWAPWLKGPAIEYYSDDAHYFRTAGLVKVYAQEWCYYQLSFEWIIDESSGERPSSAPKDNKFTVWFADSASAAICGSLIGDRMTFVYCKGNFQRLSIPDSIVQISYQGLEILSYEEGKTVFLQYVSSLRDDDYYD